MAAAGPDAGCTSLLHRLVAASSKCRPRRVPLILAAALLVPQGPACGQSPALGGQPPPPGMSLAESAARRFPQPVATGWMRGRTVLQPVESQAVLGRVERLVRDGTGQVQVVMRFGGVLGFGARPIAIPLDAFVLLGDVVEVAGFTPAQLQAFPTYAGQDPPLPTEETVRVGLAKPSH